MIDVIERRVMTLKAIDIVMNDEEEGMGIPDEVTNPQPFIDEVIRVRDILVRCL